MKVPCLLFPLLFFVAGSAPPSANGTAVTLLRVGLGPEAIAASSVASTSVADMVTDLQQSSPAQGNELALADAAYATARQERDALRRLVRSGQATPAQVLELAQAQQTLDTATTARQAVLDALFTAATSDLSTAQKDVLAEIRANARWKLPTEFLVIERTQPQWIQLRDLLMEEKICAKIGDTMDPASVTALAALRAAPAVATAKAQLDANLAAVQAAWDLAVGN